MKQLIIAIELQRLMPKLSRSQAESFAPHLEVAMREHDIVSKRRRCAFLAQLAHESEELTKWQENLNYNASRLLVIFPTKFRSITEADSYAHRPVAIGNHVYANRMGNGDEASGDGYKFRGRGPIGLTGRVNYRIFGDDLGLPLEQDPDMAARTEHGFRIAALFWKRAGCNRLADKLTMTGDNADRAVLERITKVINGGRNGLADRLNYFRVAKQVLQDDEQPAAATQPVPAAPAKSPAPSALDQVAGPDVDVFDAAVASPKARAVLWPRIVKHGAFGLAWIEGLTAAHHIAGTLVVAALIAGAGWLVYHNWKRIKGWLLVLMQCF
jgi:putative chitinase